MEIRLMEKNKKTGRFVNVEIYDEYAFGTLIRNSVRDALNEMTIWQRMRAEYKTVIDNVYKKVFKEFDKRLKQNLN